MSPFLAPNGFLANPIRVIGNLYQTWLSSSLSPSRKLNSDRLGRKAVLVHQPLNHLHVARLILAACSDRSAN